MEETDGRVVASAGPVSGRRLAFPAVEGFEGPVSQADRGRRSSAVQVRIPTLNSVQ